MVCGVLAFDYIDPFARNLKKWLLHLQVWFHCPQFSLADPLFVPFCSSHCTIHVSSLIVSLLHIFCICSLNPSLCLWSQLFVLLSIFCACRCSPSSSRLTLVFWLSSDWSSASVSYLFSNRLAPLTDPLAYMQKQTFPLLDPEPPKRLDIITLANNQSPDDPKRCDNKKILSCWSTFIWLCVWN